MDTLVRQAGNILQHRIANPSQENQNHDYSLDGPVKPDRILKEIVGEKTESCIVESRDTVEKRVKKFGLTLRKNNIGPP